MNAGDDTAGGFRSGYVALVGRPNVGKSTLLNRLLGQKISITSSKPQTTRHRILGIKTRPGEWQIVYVDTPGLHKRGSSALNRYLNRAAAAILNDVDVIVFLVEALRWTEEDEMVLERLASVRAPVILLVNKVDKVKDKRQLLPFLDEMRHRREFAAIVPGSARQGKNLKALEQEIISRLPEGPALFPEDMITDRSQRFLAAEIIREKLMRMLGQEVPYHLTVEIERYEETPGLVRIGAVIWVMRPNQKAIVIGKGGQRLKEVGIQARRELEVATGKKVHLELWVKVKEGWADDERALRSLGYADE